MFRDTISYVKTTQSAYQQHVKVLHKIMPKLRVFSIVSMAKTVYHMSLQSIL